MSDENISRDKSPKAPRLSLVDAIESVRKLHAKAGRASIKREITAGPLGYSGMNGAAQTALATLTQYGLIEQKQGTVSVSPLAVKLIHPVNDEQRLEAMRESALRPKIFSDLYNGGYHACAEDVLANHLIQEGFAPEAAKKVAKIYHENSDVAKLDPESYIPSQVHNGDDSVTLDDAESKEKVGTVIAESTTESRSQDAKPGGGDSKSSAISTGWSLEDKKMLAKYSIPLGANEATIVFTGESLSPDDFDALADYVALFKKQFERRIKNDGGDTLKGFRIDPRTGMPAD